MFLIHLIIGRNALAKPKKLCLALFFPSAAVPPTFCLCRWAAQSLRKDLPASWYPEAVITTDSSLQVKNNQLPAIVMYLTFLRLLGSPAVCNLWVTQTVWHSRPDDLHTKGTCYWDHPFPVDRLWPRWSGCSCFEQEAWTRLFMVLRLADCPPMVSVAGECSSKTSWGQLTPGHLHADGRNFTRMQYLALLSPPCLALLPLIE